MVMFLLSEGDIKARVVEGLDSGGGDQESNSHLDMKPAGETLVSTFLTGLL